MFKSMFVNDVDVIPEHFKHVFCLDVIASLTRIFFIVIIRNNCVFIFYCLK